MNFLMTYELLENLQEDSGKNRYLVSYYESGVKKSFTVIAASKEEAKSIAWSKVDADDIWVELDESVDDPENLSEAKRVISDPDILYHYTNPNPLYKILTADCLKSNIHCNAVCLTTDEDYKIYDYPCGIQFSREKLISDGYELVEFDEFDDDAESAGESEERIYEDITNVTKYITAVYVDWDKIEIVQSPEGYRIADAKYEACGEVEEYSLLLSQFRFLLMRLGMKGIKVVETGKPQYGKYHLDDSGTLKYGGKVMAFA